MQILFEEGSTDQQQQHQPGFQIIIKVVQCHCEQQQKHQQLANPTSDQVWRPWECANQPPVQAAACQPISRPPPSCPSSRIDEPPTQQAAVPINTELQPPNISEPTAAAADWERMSPPLDQAGSGSAWRSAPAWRPAVAVKRKKTPKRRQSSASLQLTPPKPLSPLQLPNSRLRRRSAEQLIRMRLQLEPPEHGFNPRQRLPEPARQIRAKSPSFVTMMTPPPTPEANDEEFEVERIIDFRRRTPTADEEGPAREFAGMKIHEYLVRFTGYGPEHDLWLPSRLINAPMLIREFNLNLRRSGGNKSTANTS